MNVSEREDTKNAFFTKLIPLKNTYALSGRKNVRMFFSPSTIASNALFFNCQGNNFEK